MCVHAPVWKTEVNTEVSSSNVYQIFKKKKSLGEP